MSNIEAILEQKLKGKFKFGKLSSNHFQNMVLEPCLKNLLYKLHYPFTYVFIIIKKEINMMFNLKINYVNVTSTIYY